MENEIPTTDVPAGREEGEGEAKAPVDFDPNVVIFACRH